MNVIMSKSKGKGTERVLMRLKSNIELGQYYEAHQMFRTLYFRYLSQKKFDELIPLLFDGSKLFFAHNQHNSGSDLAILLINVFNESGAPVSEDHMGKLGYLFALMIPDSPERTNFLTSALKWSNTNLNESTFGHPYLHQSIALTLWKEKNYQQSRYHFIHSTNGYDCAIMLIEYHVTKGYPSEVDLFIAQTVLQYLCLKNMSTASTAFYTYTEKHPAVNSGYPYLLPLLNFLHLLLETVERSSEGGSNMNQNIFSTSSVKEHAPKWNRLTYFYLYRKYELSLKRDPCYIEYVDRIGQLFFGLSAPPKQQGLFGNILHSLFDGLDESFTEEEPVAGPSRCESFKINQEDLD